MELLEYTFFRNALAGIVMLSIASAIIGTYIVTRRLVSMTGGITHACFGGLGLGYYLGINPILSASVFAVASSIGVEWLADRHKVREDSAIAAVWSIGMAVGVIFVFLTPGYVPELNSFLFGNILTIGTGDIILFAVFTAILIAYFLLNFNKIVICAFDRDFATVAGLPVKMVNYTMTVLIAVCIVLTIRLVGIMLLLSMFTLPQMAAEVFVNRFKSMVSLSVLISLAASVGGLFLSTLGDVPCSAVIVAVMCFIYFIFKIIGSRR